MVKPSYSWKLFLSCIILCMVLISPVLLGQESPRAPEDAEMEDRIRKVLTEIVEYSHTSENEKTTEIVDLKFRVASEFFEYFLKHTNTPTGIKAGRSAFMLWGSLGAVEEIENAIPQAPKDSEVWQYSLHSIGNAYASHEMQEYFDLLFRLEDELTDPGSQSNLMLILAGVYGRDFPDKEKAYLEKVIALEANPFDVQKARSRLYELASLNVGQAAPNFKARTIDGAEIALSDFRGKYVLLEFWATYCGPCMPDIPHLKALIKDLPPDGLQIIGISKDKDLKILRRFVEDQEMPWPQIQQVGDFEEDGTLSMDTILELYNVFGIPRSFLVDPKGMIAAKELHGEEIETVVRKLVKEIME